MTEQFEFEFHPPNVQLPQLWTPDDIYQSLDAEIIKRFSEDSRIERKTCNIHARELGDYLSMWANTQPHGGLILLGIENKGGRISGCKSLSTPELNKLEVVNRYCPEARHEFRRVPVKNENGEDDFVIAVRVFYREDRLVETTDGDAFVRVGEQKRKLTESEKREIRINKGEVDYELDPVPTLKWPTDFDLAIVDDLVSSYIEKRSLTNRYEREDILSLLHLGKRKGAEFICEVSRKQNSHIPIRQRKT